MSERAAIFMFCDEITDKSLDNSMQQLKSLGRYINPKNNGPNVWKIVLDILILTKNDVSTIIFQYGVFVQRLLLLTPFTLARLQCITIQDVIDKKVNKLKIIIVNTLACRHKIRN